MLKRMKTKIKLLAILIVVLQGMAFAQQSPIYTQYMFNDFVVNPAIAGTHDYYQIRLNNRYQWVGLKDAPITYTLSVYGPHKKLPMGWGGTVYSDSQGPTGKIGVYGSYGYNISIKKDIRLSFGLSVGLIQYRLDMTRVTFADDAEYLSRSNYSFTKPDATFGIYGYATRYFAGLSMDQLFGNRVSIARDSSNKITFNNLVRHTTLVGGYKFNINRDFDMEPTALMRTSGLFNTFQVEITAKTIWRKMAWGGLSFRSSDAVVILAGYNYKDQIYVGYSYDINYSGLRKYNSGSHEIMIGARFNKIRSSGRSKL